MWLSGDHGRLIKWHQPDNFQFTKEENPMKRILVVLGGGRPKGNTRQLADAFIQGAVDAGHEIELVSLNQVEVKGCMGCNACQYGKPCIQKDGFSEFVPKVKAADLIVFASLLLFRTISAKLKAFIDFIASQKKKSAIGTV